jgi:hypothetical protein
LLFQRAILAAFMSFHLIEVKQSGNNERERRKEEEKKE